MKKILIINPFGIGDVLFTTPVVQALKKEFPDSFIAYLCNRQVEPVLRNNPDIDMLLFYTRGDLKALHRQSLFDYLKTLLLALHRVRSMRFDIAFDLSLVNQYSVVLRLLGVRRRYGFDYKGRGLFLTDKIAIKGFREKHVVDYYQDLLKLAGIAFFERKTRIYMSAADKKSAEELLRVNSLSSGELRIGCAPFGGASWGKDARRKQWPLENYAAVVKKIITRHRAKIIIFGVAADRQNFETLKKMLGGQDIIDMVGKTDLGQLAALISGCALFLGNDSGPLHLACACGVKTVSIFGPADKKVYGPIGDADCHIVVSANTPCRPCYKNFQKPNCTEMNCLRDIREQDVLNAIERLL
ncbi:MAG: glycosyltransferase family 9 protein [Candidatus Omnitrophica bacterium]|nr:glycosyltransferase family 9 protein [Candidatus Omnitrophota bacterium]MBU4478934.1 glycosyltransferase family 9 protein [Candidatus Omnitrophota bacterium]MCG2704392.1 glycosyltransferase family 9 protein [Candidatus Omnitrophota bacterium]